MPPLDSHKAKAHRAVRQAVLMGRLVRPDVCHQCGMNPGPARDGRSQIQGHHHKGYDAPLDVEWLCVHCHRKETPKPYGTRKPNARLTDDLVRHIRVCGEPTPVLAARYGVSTTTIKRARNGSQWAHIPLSALKSEGVGG